MKCLVTGANGQLGFDTVRVLRSRGHKVLAASRAPSENDSDAVFLDVTDERAVRKLLLSEKFDMVFHCAAYTAVDNAELPENAEIVNATNIDATRYLSRAAAEINAVMVYISTDYVFSGTGAQAWSPDNSVPAPVNYYGESKLQGEKEVQLASGRFFIVRTSWVFGSHGRNFVSAMCAIGKKSQQVRVVNDQIGRPTYTIDLAELLADMCQSSRYGIYHATNSGPDVSRDSFCHEIFSQTGIEAEIIPVSTEDFGRIVAKRPHNSRLDNGKLAENGFTPLPSWQNALTRYFKELETASL